MNLGIFFSKYSKSPINLCFAFLITSIVLLDLAHRPEWRGHLQADTIIYQRRACSFLEARSWQNIPHNEYQPGALWWMCVPALIPIDYHNYDAYITAYWLTSLILLGVYIVLARRYGPAESPWMLLLLAIATGPILLYRFEFVVSLLVFVAWLLWERHRWVAAAFVLGIAASTKVYPLVLLPALVIQVYRVEGRSSTGRALFGFLGGVAAAVGTFLLAGGKVREMYEAMMFHKVKPVGVDGLFGSIIPVLQEILGIPLRMTPTNSIHGFACDIFPVSLVLDWIWVLAYGMVLIAITRGPVRLSMDAGALVALLMGFLIIQKNNAPQYSWWAISLLPMISARWFSVACKRFLFAVVIIALVLGQIVYPLNYQSLLNNFYNGHPLATSFFWINLSKNLLWVLALGLAIWPVLPPSLALDIRRLFVNPWGLIMRSAWHRASPAGSELRPPDR